MSEYNFPIVYFNEYFRRKPMRLFEHESETLFMLRETEYNNFQYISIIDHENQLKKKDEEIEEVIKLCLPYHDMMWASKIMGILLNCDFRESAVKAKEWLEKHKEIK